MAYTRNVIEQIKSQPMSLGVRLGRWAIFLDIPAAKIALATGATRQSVYNWFKGGEVARAYRPAVELTIACMQGAKTGEEAWEAIRQQFGLQV